MTNNEQQHPITPPDELVEQWALAAIARFPDDGPSDLLSIEEARDEYVATQAARWGYEQRGAVNEAELQQARDEEFEACCELLRNEFKYHYLVEPLRLARRPKPKSLKEQALAQTNAILNDPNRVLLTEVRETLELNRRALEALPE